LRGNRENIPGILDTSFEYIHTPTSIAKQLYLYIEYIGHAYCDKRYCLSRKSYAHFLLMYVLGGNGVLCTQGRDYVLEPGQAFLIETARSHIYGALGDFETLWVHFNGLHFADFYNHMIAANGGHVFMPKDQMTFMDKFLHLIRDQEAATPQPEIMVSAKLYELLALLVAKVPGSQESPINTAINYINRNYSEKITIDMLAKQVSISASRFSTLFKQETGYSPYYYIINTRLHAAYQLLSSCSNSIEHIALDVGFNDASSFIYSFRKKYKITPAQFRKRLSDPPSMARTQF
jgi:AraC-like DNA-binding protein